MWREDLISAAPRGVTIPTWSRPCRRGAGLRGASASDGARVPCGVDGEPRRRPDGGTFPRHHLEVLVGPVIVVVLGDEHAAGERGAEGGVREVQPVGVG